MKKNSRALIWVALLGALAFVLSGCLFKPTEGGMISIGRPYQYFNFEVRPDYPDLDGMKLTDGKLGDYTSPGHGPWVGLWKGEEEEKPGTIVMDLGSSQSVGEVKAYFLSGSWSILAPAKMEVYVSDDAETWSGPFTYEPGPYEGKVGLWYTATVNKVGRYVRCDLTFNGGNIWVSEIAVFQ